MKTIKTLPAFLCLTVSVAAGVLPAKPEQAIQQTEKTGAIRAAANTKAANNDNSIPAVQRAMPLQPSKPKKNLSQKHTNIQMKALDRHLTKNEINEEAALPGRDLKKSKTGKLGSGWWDGDDWGDDKRMRDDDDKKRDDDKRWNDDKKWDDDDFSNKRKGGKSGKIPGSGKSGKWDSSDWSSDKSGDFGDECKVTVTNLSFEQSFSDLFVMVHAKQVTKRRPIYTFGNRTDSSLAELAQDLDTNGMMNRYEHFPGVRDARVIGNFGEKRKYLNGGARKEFRIKPSSNFNRISIAAGFPFANDAAIVLQGELIYDGADYYLPALDVGAEANLQTCWSVAAEQEDFPSNSECNDEKMSDENDNSFGGENFVHIHRGMQDLDGKGDLDTITLLECDEADLDKSDDDTRFALYFLEEGYDDDWLLCKTVAGDNCGLRGDDDFLEYIADADDFGSDDVLINIARNSDDFDDFCKRIEDINKDLESLFKVLEPVIFDFRNPIAHVEIDCDY